MDNLSNCQSNVLPTHVGFFSEYGIKKGAVNYLIFFLSFCSFLVYSNVAFSQTGTVTVNGTQNNVPIVNMTVEINTVDELRTPGNKFTNTQNTPAIIKTIVVSTPDGPKELFATSRFPIASSANDKLGDVSLNSRNEVSVVKSPPYPTSLPFENNNNPLVFTSHESSDFFSDLASAVSVPDLRTYWNINGEDIVSYGGEGFVNLRYPNEISQSGYLLLTEREGNSEYNIIALDINGDIIQNSRAIHIRGFQWNTGISNDYASPQEQFIVAISPSIFQIPGESLAPIYGFQVVDLTDSDGKFVFFVNQVTATPDNVVLCKVVDQSTGTILNIYENDELDGTSLPVDANGVPISTTTFFAENSNGAAFGANPPAPFMVTSSGDVSLPIGTGRGTYSFKYRLTENEQVDAAVDETVVTITIEDPDFNVTSPIVVCDGTSPNVDITTSISDANPTNLAFTYWRDAEATTNEISEDDATVISQSGTYYIKGTTPNGCSVIKPVIVVINSTPSIPSVTVVDPNCQVSTGSVSVETPVQGEEYALDASFTNTIFTDLAPGDYTMYARTEGTVCVVATPFTVSEKPLTPAAPVVVEDVEKCANETIQKLTATAEVEVGNTLIWYDAEVDGDVVADPSLNQIGTITYWAEAVSPEGCKSSRVPVTLTLNTCDISILKSIVENNTFEKVGDEIQYEYIIKNSGNVTLPGPFQVIDDKINDIPPFLGSLEVGEQATITATYSVIEEDLEKKEVTNLAFATTTFEGKELKSNEAKATANFIGIEIIELRSECRADAPYIIWDLSGINLDLIEGELSNTPVTIVWIDTDGNTITSIPGLPLVGELLYPGAEVDSEGRGTQWPGWAFQNGQWVQGDFRFAAVREPGTKIRFEINPEITSEEVGYPEATATCNPNPNPPLAIDDDMTGTPVVSETGFVDIVNVLDNDQLNGKTGLTTPGDVIITLIPENSSQELVLDVDTGFVSVLSETPSGIYTLEYKICTVPGDNLANCTTAIVTVLVVTPSIEVLKDGLFNDENQDGLGDEGETIIYTFKVINTGDVVLNNITIEDAKVDVQGGPLNGLEPGESNSIEFTATYVLTQTDVDNGVVLNIATGKGEGPDGYVVEGESSESNPVGTSSNPDCPTCTETEIPQNLSIDLDKTVDVASVNREGVVLNYTLTITNDGNVTLSSGNLVDPKTGLNLPEITLAPGEMRSFSTTYTVTLEDILSGEPILNIANVTAVNSLSGQTVEAEDEVTVNVNLDPALSLVKVVDKTEIVEIGEVLTYTIIVENTGTAPILDLVINDPLTGLNETIDLLLSGDSQEFTTTYTVTAVDAENSSLINIATAEGTVPGGDKITAEDAVELPFNLNVEEEPDPIPGISFTKEVDISTVSEIGQVITFTLTVTNIGEEDLVNVTITDDMINVSETIDLLQIGDSAVVTGTYTVTTEDLEANQSFFNFASASGGGGISRGIVTETDFVEISVEYNMIVANDDDFGAHFISFGGSLGNILANDLLNGIVSPDPDLVDFEFTDLDGVIGLLINDNGELSLIPGVNEAREYRLKYTLRETANPSNSDDAFVVFRLLNDQVDLAVEKTSFEVEIYEGDEFEYEIRLTNVGGTPATGVMLIDDLPGSVNYLISNLVSVSDPQIELGTPAITGSRITWEIPFFPADGEVVIRVRVMAGDASTITNIVEVSAEEEDLELSNNRDDDINTIHLFRIPNVITPSLEDGDNDTFEILGLGKFVSNEIVIFNRYGDHVLETEDYQNDWNAPGQVAGTYFYILTAVDSEGKPHEFRGWIQVIKE